MKILVMLMVTVAVTMFGLGGDRRRGHNCEMVCPRRDFAQIFFEESSP